MNPTSALGAGLGLSAWLTLVGCGHHAGPAPTGSSSSRTPVASALPSGSASAAAPAAKAVAFDPDPSATMPTDFAGARSNKVCRATTGEIASYQKEGALALGAHKSGVGAVWLVHLGGKGQLQIAFSSLDTEGRPVARPRGVGLVGEGTGRVFGSGSGFTVTWFDDKGLAYARPKVEPLPAPEIAHLSMFGPEVAGDVALASTEGGSVVAAAPFGAEKNQLGLFKFSPAEEDAPQVTALGVTHHAIAPKRPAVASGAEATFVAWFESDGRIVASRFDAKDKETDSACVVAPPSTSERSHLSLAAAGSGAVAMWMEGSLIRVRALDGAGCPTSPAWKLGEGRDATVATFADSPIVAWMASDGRLLAAKLGPNAAPPTKGINVAEGSTGLKDPPALTVVGARIAFGWSEPMSAVVSTRRLVLRLIDGACMP